MVKCDNCHDNIDIVVSDELTSWPLQVCGDKPIRGLPQLFEFNGFFPLLETYHKAVVLAFNTLTCIILLFFYSQSELFCAPIEIDTSVIKTF